jgi:hypothetical protein
MDKTVALLKLVDRSADAGDGWRQVKDGGLWQVISRDADLDYFEINNDLRRIRMTDAGKALLGNVQ